MYWLCCIGGELSVLMVRKEYQLCIDCSTVKLKYGICSKFINGVFVLYSLFHEMEF